MMVNSSGDKCSAWIASTIAMLMAIQAVSANDLKELEFHTWQQAYRENQRLLVVMYNKDNCEELCKATLETMSILAGQPDLPEGIELAKSADSELVAKLGVLQFPLLVYLRDKSHLFYDGRSDVEEILHWLQLSNEKATQRLDDTSFERLTQAATGATTGDWLVVFFQEKCSTVLPILESVGVRIKQRTNVAKVDIRNSPVLVDRFSIQKCPEIIMFKQGKMYRYELPKTDLSTLRLFADNWYKNSKAEPVPGQKSSFDHLTEDIARTIQQQLEGENRTLALAGLCGIIALLLLVLVCCCRSVIGQNAKQKKM